MELLDLYPTLSNLCGLPKQSRLQGRDISPLLDDPTVEVRDAAFSVAPMRKGFLLRTHDYAYMQYEEDASKGIELFDVKKDPDGYTNLAEAPEYADVVKEFREKMKAKLAEVRANDLEL